MRLCEVATTGQRVATIVEPGALGPEEGSGEQAVDFGTLSIPVHTSPTRGDDGGFDSPVRGQLYFPADSSGKKIAPGAFKRPLVVIAHGYWTWDQEDQSQLGYAWLAHHLARWGMFVLSIDLAEANLKSGDAINGPSQQFARAELILAAAERALAAPVLEGRLNPGRVGLVGHSMGGEAVLIAQVLGLSRPGLTVRGVVSISPTNYRPDISMMNANYLQLHGSHDYLLSSTTRFPPIRSSSGSASTTAPGGTARTPGSKARGTRAGTRIGGTAHTASAKARSRRRTAPWNWTTTRRLGSR